MGVFRNARHQLFHHLHFSHFYQHSLLDFIWSSIASSIWVQPVISLKSQMQRVVSEPKLYRSNQNQVLLVHIVQTFPGPSNVFGRVLVRCFVLFGFYSPLNTEIMSSWSVTFPYCIWTSLPVAFTIY